MTYPRMHVSLYVKDINETIQFYNSFFKQEPTKIKPQYTKYTLDEPSLVISFIENPARVQSNFGHLGFQVDSASRMNELLSEARAKNMVKKEEIGTACCYALQDKFWVEDPSGHAWEVYYLHADSEFNDVHFADDSQCCFPDQKVEVVKEQVDAACCEPGLGCC